MELGNGGHGRRDLEDDCYVELVLECTLGGSARAEKKKNFNASKSEFRVDHAEYYDG